MQELTSARATINLAGPLSRQILEQVADGDVSNAAFPYMTARELRIGFAPVLALRVTYLGELGWELHLPTEYAAHVYELLCAAGASLASPMPATAPSIAAAGEALPLLGRRHHARLHALRGGPGLRRVAQEEADFIGRAALEKAKAAGPARKLITLLVDADVQLYGGEAIRRNGKVLGVTSSAGWGHTIGKAIAFGYVPAEEAGHADYEIEAFTRRHAATRIDGAAVDPERKEDLGLASATQWAYFRPTRSRLGMARSLFRQRLTHRAQPAAHDLLVVAADQT